MTFKKATLNGLIEEFNEFLANFDDEANPPIYFIDSMLKDFEEDSPGSYLEYKTHIENVFDDYFEKMLREILDKRLLPFPLKMEDLRAHVFNSFPTEDAKKNSYFLMQQTFEDFLTKTIENHKMATVKWEQEGISLITGGFSGIQSNLSSRISV